MDFEETNVNGTPEAEDSLPEELVEDTGEPEQDLDTMLGEDGDSGQAAEEEAEDDQGSDARKEPGYVQKRLSKAVNKAVSEVEARFKAQIEAMEARYAPMQERLMEMDAQELVRTKKVGDIETARELVRLRQGLPPAAPEQVQGDQPRQANGQFAPKQDSAAEDRVRIEMLKHQRDKIKAAGGPDVIDEWNSNPEIKEKVIKGEMDFYDVAEYMRNQKPSRKKPPSPTRSPNGANGYGQTTIENMSDAQFRKLDKMLDEGVRFTLKR